jgi:predicted ATPase
VGAPNVFLPDGSNLPWVVHHLEQHAPERLAAWIEHLKSPLDGLERIETVAREEDRSRYLLVTYANGLRAPSWLLSDGTLRLLALTALAYAPQPPSLLLIEEPENGIHPRGVEAVLQSLSSVYDSQVFCATHSPLVLSLVKPKDLLCFSKSAEGAISITRGDKHPMLQEWRSSVHLGDLFAAGVLE